jgi:hypothetical protein
MQLRDLYSVFIDRIESVKIKYMITGAFASIVYGEPRLTHDIDLVMELNVEDIDVFMKQFPGNEFYCPPYEVIKVEVRRNERGHFNIIHHETGFRADIYIAGTDTFMQWALGNVNKIPFNGNSVRVAPPEYVIIKKLEYYREGGSDKHLRDIKAILDISSGIIDMQQLDSFIATYSLESEWKKIRR